MRSSKRTSNCFANRRMRYRYTAQTDKAAKVMYRVRNHQLLHHGGSMVMSIAAPGSLQLPLLVAPCTRKRYFAAGRFVYVTERRSLSTSFHESSRPSSM